MNTRANSVTSTPLSLICLTKKPNGKQPYLERQSGLDSVCLAHNLCASNEGLSIYPLAPCLDGKRRAAGQEKRVRGGGCLWLCVASSQSFQLLSEQSSCCCGGRAALLSVPRSTHVPLHTVSKDSLGPSITTRATGAGLQIRNEQTPVRGLRACIGHWQVLRREPFG